MRAQQFWNQLNHAMMVTHELVAVLQHACLSELHLPHYALAAKSRVWASAGNQGVTSAPIARHRCSAVRHLHHAGRSQAGAHLRCPSAMLLQRFYFEIRAAAQARGWATAIYAGVHDGGLERNSAAYVFEVAITLTEAGLAAAPGALCCCCTALPYHSHRILRLVVSDVQLPHMDVRQQHQGLGACRR